MCRAAGAAHALRRAAFRRQTLKTPSPRGDGMRPGDGLNDHEADIVPITGIARTGVSQSDQEQHAVRLAFPEEVVARIDAAKSGLALQHAPAPWTGSYERAVAGRVPGHVFQKEAPDFAAAQSGLRFFRGEARGSALQLLTFSQARQKRHHHLRGQHSRPRRAPRLRRERPLPRWQRQQLPRPPPRQPLLSPPHILMEAQW